MKILYGINATGNGHISRSRITISELKKRGHNVTVLFSGRKVKDFFDVEEFRPYIIKKGFTFVFKNGKLNVFKTLLNIDLIQFVRDVFKIKKEYEVRDEDGPIRYSLQASRYDYLRIAKAILDDWQNDTCVGKYLKSIHERKISKNLKEKNDKLNNRNAKSYAGFFHTSYSGMAKRNVMGMNGYGGQAIVIDFDKGRIIVVNSLYRNYNWKKIVYSVIKG